MIAAIFIFSFILSALWVVLSLSSSSRNDLFTVLECDVHGHTVLLFIVSARQGVCHRREEPSLEMTRRCSPMFRASIAARGRLTSPVSTSVSWEGA